MPHNPCENLAKISCMVQVHGESSARSAWKIAQKLAQNTRATRLLLRYEEAQTLPIFKGTDLELNVTN